MTRIKSRQSVAVQKIEAIASEIYDVIVWKDSLTAFVQCPGKHLHSRPNGNRDCWLKISPEIPWTSNIYCQHNSCRTAVDSSNKKFQSRIGSAFKNSSKRFSQICGEDWSRNKLEKDFVQKQTRANRAAWSNQLPHILSKYHWKALDAANDSPSDIWEIRKAQEPEWVYFVDAIFQPDDVVFIGGKQSKSPRNFKTAKHWLEKFGHDRESLFSKDYYLQKSSISEADLENAENFGMVHISRFSWKPGIVSRSHSNRKEERAIVLESDELGEQVLSVFKWLVDCGAVLIAIVYSGNKSFHGWFKPDGKLKSTLLDIAPCLKIDEKVITGNSTARLPGALRPTTFKNQDLIYLNRDWRCL